jgi:AcrR family transcriptional regulator
MKNITGDVANTRKERERIFRRKEIMEASANLFAEKGFNSTTLEEIAELSEFGKGTLYNYFSGKEEIYTGIIEDVIENQTNIIKNSSANSGNFIEFITLYTKNLFNYFFSNSNSFVIFVREIANLNTSICVNPDTFKKKYSEIIDVFTKQIEKGIKEKKIKKFEPERLIVLYDYIVLPYIHHHIVCKKVNRSIEEETDFLLSVLFEGILIK